MFRAALPALVASLLTTAAVGAETSVADFYKNRNIDVYIGFSVGGVYDVNARLLSRFMGRHIPGNPNFIPRQLTGAGSLTLANWPYQAAPKDGSAIGTFARGIAFNPLIGQPAGAIEATKFNWLGSTNDEVSICAAAARAASRNLHRCSNGNWWSARPAAAAMTISCPGC